MTRFDGLVAVVAGAGVSGAAAARALRDRGADVVVVDGSEERAAPLREEGLVVVDADAPPPGTHLVVTSPGWRPDAPLLVAAQRAGVEVIGEVALAQRLAGPGGPDWLAVTGTNGKTTTVTLLEQVLRADGRRTVAAGNIGLPLVEAVQGPYDVLAVELSSFQLHWSPDVVVHAGAVLNVADDHVDWHGSADAYARDKARIWAHPGAVAVGGVDDPVARRLLRAAPGRQVGCTLGSPRVGELGVVEHLLVDRAFPDVPGEATALGELSDVRLAGDHNVANALVAAALARAYGASADAVAEGLRRTEPGAHRNALVAVHEGVTWVDDSKATNPHAAAASLSAHAPVVWLAGGLLKGARVEELVEAVAPRLRGVVLLGTDRAAFAEALARHAPEIPVVEVARLDTGAMLEAVTAAGRLAVPGDTVLLAPAAASMDCFRDYAERGRLFAEAVRVRTGGAGADGGDTA